MVRNAQPTSGGCLLRPSTEGFVARPIPKLGYKALYRNTVLQADERQT